MALLANMSRLNMKCSRQLSILISISNFSSKFGEEKKTTFILPLPIFSNKFSNRLYILFVEEFDMIKKMLRFSFLRWNFVAPLITITFIHAVKSHVHRFTLFI